MPDHWWWTALRLQAIGDNSRARSGGYRLRVAGGAGDTAGLSSDRDGDLSPGVSALQVLYGLGYLG